MDVLIVRDSKFWREKVKGECVGWCVHGEETREKGSKARTRWGTDSTMRSRPSSAADHASSGTVPRRVLSEPSGRGSASWEEGVGLRMPLMGTLSLLEVAAGVDEAGSSSISGFREEDGSEDGPGDEVGEKGAVGTRAGRGLSLPLEAMLGVPICLDRRRPC